MSGMMLGLVGAGILLFFAAPLISRALVRGGDPTGLARIIQVVAVILMVVALVFRPHSDETAAFPPPPDLMDEPAR